MPTARMISVAGATSVSIREASVPLQHSHRVCMLNNLESPKSNRPGQLQPSVQQRWFCLTTLHCIWHLTVAMMFVHLPALRFTGNQCTPEMYASTLHRPSLDAQSRAAETRGVSFCYTYEHTRFGDGCSPRMLRHSCILCVSVDLEDAIEAS